MLSFGKRFLCRRIIFGSYRFSGRYAFDPYDVLGISRSADESTIKNAYIKLAKTYHPDRNPDNAEAKEKFIKIQNAYRAIMETLVKEEQDDGSRSGMPYSFTISPLGVENHPPPKTYERTDVKNILKISLVFTMFMMASMIQKFRGKSPAESVDEEEKFEADVEDYRRYLNYQQQRTKKIDKAGQDLSTAVTSIFVGR
ncbi:unnamed protein product [Clavelina lepadiformis]|uniref:DnaJ homolog subfamily B member 9 n=1 Tax=Clavelina lepadiformis TaxID=159417 RepID=A0ABP0FD60_CLALP